MQLKYNHSTIHVFVLTIKHAGSHKTLWFNKTSHSEVQQLSTLFFSFERHSFFLLLVYNNKEYFLSIRKYTCLAQSLWFRHTFLFRKRISRLSRQPSELLDALLVQSACRMALIDCTFARVSRASSTLAYLSSFIQNDLTLKFTFSP